jgi:hypothetical protein
MAAEVKEDVMPPLTTPTTAVVFMIGFFIVMMGIPLSFVRIGHHAPK